MDSASKAIIIAGGVLIGMLVIAVSMYMLTSFRTFYEQSMEQFEMQQITSFNSFFTQYTSPIKGYDAYNIIGKINEINADDNSNYSISFVDTITREGTFYFTENLNKDYNYSYSYDSDGVIKSVTITESAS